MFSNSRLYTNQQFGYSLDRCPSGTIMNYLWLWTIYPINIVSILFGKMVNPQVFFILFYASDVLAS